MHPAPTMGSLAVHVYPLSSLIAMMPNEKPSEYIGTRIRPDGSSSGCVRVNHPMREKYSSLACAITRFAYSAVGPDPAASFPAHASVLAAMFFGISMMLSWNSHFGGPSACW